MDNFRASDPIANKRNTTTMRNLLSFLTLSVLILIGPTAETQGLPLGSDILGTRLDWHPNDTMLAASDNQSVKIIDATNQQTLNTLPSFAEFVTDVSWNPDGNRLAIAFGSSVQVWTQAWEAGTAELELTIQAPTDLAIVGVTMIAWHPSGDRILGVNSPNVHVWDATNGQLLRTFDPNKTPLLTAGWSPDGNQIAYANTTGLIVVEDLVTGEVASIRLFDQSAVRSLVWSQAGNQFASGTSSGIIQIASLDGFLAGSGSLETGVENIIALDWHPNSLLLASGSFDGTLAIWDIETKDKLGEIYTGSAIPSVNWDSTGGKLAYSDSNDSINVLQIPTADAGPDQTLTDSDDTGSELVTLDGSGSSDPDGTIESYVWTEDDVEIATGVNPQVSLSVGVHNVTLTVTDDDGLTDTDEVIITINPPAVTDTPTPTDTPVPGGSVLDDFNRSDGAVGSNWSGDTNEYSIVNNQLVAGGQDTAIIWNGAAFGADQEAEVWSTPDKIE